MDWILTTTTSWVRSFREPIAFSFIATLLVIYGDDINKWIKKATTRYQFAVRVLVFILVSGFGYGWATSELQQLLIKILRFKTGQWEGLIVIGCFIGLGILADKKNQV